MASIAEKQLEMSRALVLDVAAQQLRFAADMAKKGRRSAAQCMKRGELIGHDAFIAMAEAFEADIVTWTRTRDAWIAKQLDTRKPAHAS